MSLRHKILIVLIRIIACIFILVKIQAQFNMQLFVVKYFVSQQTSNVFFSAVRLNCAFFILGVIFDVKRVWLAFKGIKERKGLYATANG